MILAARITLAVYVAFVVGVVGLADAGGTHAVFSFVDAVPYGDKLGHFLLIGLLALLVDLALGCRDVRRVPLGPAIVSVLVLAEELSQLALPTRTFDGLDLAADVIGIVLFVAVGRVTYRRAAPRAPSTSRR